MYKRTDLTQIELKNNLHYNPLTGIFKWKVATSNRVKVGGIAGSKHKSGYIQIRIKNKQYYAQRLAWLYMEGYFPENTIDYINRVKYDNRWKNLRHVSNQCSVRNRNIRSDNNSGIIGVSWVKKNKKWQSQICVNKKPMHLGFYKNIDDAVKVRWKNEVKYNWSNCNNTSSAYNYLKENNLI